MTFLAELGTSTYLHGGVYNLQETTQLVPRSEDSGTDLLGIDYGRAEVRSIIDHGIEGLEVKTDSDYLFQ